MGERELVRGAYCWTMWLEDVREVLGPGANTAILDLLIEDQVHVWLRGDGTAWRVSLLGLDDAVMPAVYEADDFDEDSF